MKFMLHPKHPFHTRLEFLREIFFSVALKPKSNIIEGEIKAEEEKKSH